MDITVTLSPYEAMQVQAALGDRIERMAKAPVSPGTFEAQVVDQAVAHASAALTRVVEQLYPQSEAEVSAEFEQVSLALDGLADGDHFAGLDHLPSSGNRIARGTGIDLSKQIFEGMETY